MNVDNLSISTIRVLSAESILPTNVRARVAVEAAIPLVGTNMWDLMEL
jgi:hypothetical protein